MKRFVSFGLAVLMVVFCNVSVFARDAIQYSTKGGTWTQVDESTYAMDNDADGETDVILTQEGNKWNYDFVVEDDSANYYAWEEDVPEGYEVVGRGTASDPLYSGNPAESKIVYSHTPNVDNSGNLIMGYESGVETLEAVTVPGADKLVVRVHCDLGAGTWVDESWYDNFDENDMWIGGDYYPQPYEYRHDTLYLWQGDVSASSDVLSIADSSLYSFTDDVNFSECVIDGDTCTVGLKSWDTSSTRDRFGYSIEVVGIAGLSDTVYVSKTPNLNDDGTRKNPYDSNQDFADVVTVPGADKLCVKVMWYIEPDDNFCVWLGDHPDYRASDPECVSESVVTDPAVLTWSKYNAVPNKEFYVDGDSVTFGFCSNDVNNDAMGYYAVVTGYYFDDENVRFYGTADVDDDGNIIGGYDANANIIDVVTVPGAVSLRVDITYETESSGSESDAADYLVVWEGVHDDYDVSDRSFCIKSESVSGLLFTDRYKDDGLTSVSYLVDGDSVTFGFHSNGKNNYHLGYYAVVTAILPVGDCAFSSIRALNDDGSLAYCYADNLNVTDVLTVPGSDKILVELLYDTEIPETEYVEGGYNDDWVWVDEHRNVVSVPDFVCVWEGDKSGCDVSTEYVSSISGRLAGNATFGLSLGSMWYSSDAVQPGSVSYLIDGDTCTIGFLSNDSDNNYMGYQVKVSGIVDYDLDSTIHLEPSSTDSCEETVPVVCPGSDFLFVEYTYGYKDNDRTGSSSEFAIYYGDDFSNSVDLVSVDAVGTVVIPGDSINVYFYCDNWFGAWWTSAMAGYSMTVVPLRLGGSVTSSLMDYEDVLSADLGPGISYVDAVTVPGADSLRIDLLYAGPYYDTFCFWEGSHADYTLSDLSKSVCGDLFDSTFNIGHGFLFHMSYVVPGDSVTFGVFADKLRYMLGYYAVITPIRSSDPVVSCTENVVVDAEGSIVPLTTYDADMLDIDVVSVPGAVGYYVRYDVSVCSGDSFVIVDGEYDNSWIDSFIRNISVPGSNSKDHLLYWSGKTERRDNGWTEIYIPRSKFTYRFMSDSGINTGFGYAMHVFPVYEKSDNISRTSNVNADGNWPGGFHGGSDNLPNVTTASVHDAVYCPGVDGFLVDLVCDCGNSSFWIGDTDVSSVGAVNKIFTNRESGEFAFLAESDFLSFSYATQSYGDSFKPGYYAVMRSCSIVDSVSLSNNDNYYVNHDVVDPVVIPGAKSLRVDLKYLVGASDGGVCVWEGYKPGNDVFVDCVSSLGGSVLSANGFVASKSYVVDGDSVTFGYRSILTQTSAVLGHYGAPYYHAKVTPVFDSGAGTGSVEDAEGDEFVITNKKKDVALSKGGIDITKHVESNGTKKEFVEFVQTDNVNDDGIQNGGYGDNRAFTKVCSIPGAKSLDVQIVYETESTNYDWLCMWEGDCSSKSAYSDYVSSLTGKLGGSGKKTVDYTVDGDTVTFGFRSDSSASNYYGFYAVVKATIETMPDGIPSIFGFDIELSSDDPALDKFLVGQQVFGDLAFVDGLSFCYLKSGETVSLRDIPDGIRYKITERETMDCDVAWTVDSVDSAGESVTGVVSGDDVVDVVCTNMFEKELVETGSIRVEKVTSFECDEAFDFVAVFMGLVPNGSYSYTVDGHDVSFAADVLGVAEVEFSLSSGQAVDFNKLPYGCQYRVTELANGYIGSYEVIGVKDALVLDDSNYDIDHDLSTMKYVLSSGDTPDIVFTNRKKPTLVSKPDVVSVSVNKVWNDDGDRSARPESVLVYLLESDVVVGSVVLDEFNDWSFSFNNLPKYKADGVTPAVYSVSEAAPAGYEPSVKQDGTEFVVTNTSVDSGSLSLSKVIEDGDRFDDSDKSKAILSTYFMFDMDMSLGGHPVEGVYDCFDLDGNAIGSLILDEAGHGSVSLKHGETVVIPGLPVGADVTVVEQSADGFAVDGEAERHVHIVDGAVSSVSYVNRVDEVVKEDIMMPETGGSGILGFVACGISLLVAGLLVMFRKKKAVNLLCCLLVVFGVSLCVDVDAFAVESAVIENFNISFDSGAALRDGQYVWSPASTAANHMFKYRLDYAVSGTYSQEKGSLRFELPLHILKDRDGNWADKFECAYRNVRTVNADDSPKFVYSIEGDKIVIYNYDTEMTGSSGYIEFAYTTTLPTYRYMDMVVSDDVPGVFSVTTEDGVVSASAVAPSVCIDTEVHIHSTEKLAPTYYPSWQVAWGEAPADADSWYYLMWPIYTIIEDGTQYYDFRLDDTFSDYGGSVVGYKLAGNDEYSSENVVHQLSKYGKRYDYVLTRHSKDQVEAVLDRVGHYTVNNVVKASVIPYDGIDVVSSKTSTKPWYYERPQYIRPDGHFWAEKYGIWGFDSVVRNSEDVSNFYLAEFQSGELDELGEFQYRTNLYGYPYPWTLGPGADGTVNDALLGRYGQKNVDWELVDDCIYIGGMDNVLSPDDYDIRKLSFRLLSYDAVFDADELSFSRTPLRRYSPNDEVFVSAKVNGKWKDCLSFNYYEGLWKNVNTSIVNDINGMTLYFNDGVDGVKFRFSNAYYYSDLEVRPYVTLFRTKHVMSLAPESVSKIAIGNESYSSVSQDGEVIFDRYCDGVDYAAKVIKRSNISKKIIATYNNNIDEQFDVTWQTVVNEDFVDDTGVGGIPQSSGKFYDLLPYGSLVDQDSIVVKANYVEVNPALYDVSYEYDYNGSGRTLMTIDIHCSTDRYYDLKYTTHHSWDSIRDYGKNLLNSVAYESGNDSLAGGLSNQGGRISDRYYFVDIGDSDADVFLYAEARYTVNLLLAGSNGLQKQVAGSHDSSYSYESTVFNGDTYVYHVRYENDASTRSKDMMFFDSLENFYQLDSETSETLPSDWYGELSFIDVSQIRKSGVKPVIYLSKAAHMNLYSHHDLNEVLDGEKVWLEYDAFVDKYGLGAARAICVDARKTTRNADYLLDRGKSLVFDVYMKAPSSVSGTDKFAYNNIFVGCTFLRDYGEDTVVSKFFHQDYTSVELRISNDVVFSKRSSETSDVVPGAVFALHGTSVYGTAYSAYGTSTDDGVVKFFDVEAGTYELQEDSCTADWLLNQNVYTVVVGLDGSVTINTDKNDDGTFVITNDPRIHADFALVKQSSESGTVLNGAIFRLSGTSDYGNEVIKSAQSLLGVVAFSDVEMGTYSLVEAKAPNGYICSKSVWTVVVNDTGAVDIRLDGESVADEFAGLPAVFNERYKFVDFLKMSSYGENVYLAGAKFKLSGVSDYGTEVDAVSVSDASGLVMFDNLEPGTYVLTETKAPEDHGMDESTHVVKLLEDGSFTISGLNKVTYGSSEVYAFVDPKTKGVVRVSKVWDDDLVNSERDFPDITISTERLVGDARDVIVTFDANGGYFADGSLRKTAVYTSLGAFVSGVIDDPVCDNAEYAMFKGWHVADVDGRVVDLSKSMDLDFNVQDGLVLYANWKTQPRYAVCVWDIGKDVDKNGDTMGITFGPALGGDYTASFVSHEPTGNTVSGNGHRCLHCDTWEDIVDWNHRDPYVYEQCIAKGCTKAVPIDFTNFDMINRCVSCDSIGDGLNILPFLLDSKSSDGQYISVWYGDRDWGMSRMRALLNGADNLTDRNFVQRWSDDVCILACFPNVLQDAIGARTVKYYDMNGALRTSYDPLWLPSVNEVSDGIVNFSRDYSAEGSAYAKWASIGKVTRNTVNPAYAVHGSWSDTYTRSIYSSSVFSLSGENSVSYSSSGQHGMGPCFTLSR